MPTSPERWYVDDLPTSLNAFKIGPLQLERVSDSRFWIIRPEASPNRGVVAYVREKDDAEEMVRLHNAAAPNVSASVPPDPSVHLKKGL